MFLTALMLLYPTARQSTKSAVVRSCHLHEWAHLLWRPGAAASRAPALLSWLPVRAFPKCEMIFVQRALEVEAATLVMRKSESTCHMLGVSSPSALTSFPRLFSHSLSLESLRSTSCVWRIEGEENHLLITGIGQAGS